MYLIKKTKRGGGKVLEGKIIPSMNINFKPIPTNHGGNQPIYECHVTTAGRNRVKTHLYLCRTVISSDIIIHRLWGSEICQFALKYSALKKNPGAHLGVNKRLKKYLFKFLWTEKN